MRSCLEIVEIARQNNPDHLWWMKFYDRWSWWWNTRILQVYSAGSLLCEYTGLSKISPDCRFRVGWWFYPTQTIMWRAISKVWNMLSNMRLCSNVLSQHVVQTLLWSIPIRGWTLAFQVVESTNNAISSTKLSMIFPRPSVVAKRLVSSIFPQDWSGHVPRMMTSNLF